MVLVYVTDDVTHLGDDGVDLHASICNRPAYICDFEVNGAIQICLLL